MFGCSSKTGAHCKRKKSPAMLSWSRAPIAPCWPHSLQRSTSAFRPLQHPANAPSYPTSSTTRSSEAVSVALPTQPPSWTKIFTLHNASRQAQSQDTLGAQQSISFPSLVLRTDPCSSPFLCVQGALLISSIVIVVGPLAYLSPAWHCG